MKTKAGISGFGGKRMWINYSSYAHVIEKGMNKRNMTGMTQVLCGLLHIPNGICGLWLP